MGIFDFFKKKPERKKINYEELNNWISEKNNELNLNRQSIVNEIKNSVNLLKLELNSNIEKLKLVNIDDKKAEDKLKLIVKENLEKYIGNLNYLIKSLDKLDYSSYERTMVEIDGILNDFKKRSLMHYEKATILIGEELGVTKENLSEFSRSLNKIIQENQSTINTNKNIQLINEELNTISSTNTMIEECNKKVMILNENINLKEKEIKDYQQSILDIKKSKEFKKELEEKTLIYELKIEYENKINELKSAIDFKKLSSLYHSDNKKMKIINDFKDHFKDNYKKDFEKLLVLLKDSSSYNSEIDILMNEISNLDHQLKSKESSYSNQLEKEISSKEQVILSLNNEIASSNEQISREEKIKQKFNESKLTFIDKIKAILMSMNIELN